MNYDEGEKLIIDIIDKIIQSVDKELLKSPNYRRKFIGALYVRDFSSDTEKKLNPIWDPEAYQKIVGKKETVRYITSEAGLFLTHRAITCLSIGKSVIPYNPEERKMKISEADSFFKVWPYAIEYIIEHALLRQLRKGIVWNTINGESKGSFSTNYDEKGTETHRLTYKSHVNIPEKLVNAIHLYEERKAKYNYYNWSVDVGSYSIDNLAALYSVQESEIEGYYGHPFIFILSFYYAVNDLCEYLKTDSNYKKQIGTVFSKKAFLDKLAKDKDSNSKTKIEYGLEICESILGKIAPSLRASFNKHSYSICENTLDKYMITYKNLPDLPEFLATPTLIYEIESDCILLLSFFNKQMGASIFEKPLTSSGDWKEYKGKEFEKFCHHIINEENQLKTFYYKVKDEHGIDVGDVDLGIIKEPYVFLCDCKNYAINLGIIEGDVSSIIKRIEDGKQGYKGWLNNVDSLSKFIVDKNIIDKIFKEIKINSTKYKYIIPTIIVWRPEFVLDIKEDMLTNEIPRVCTIYELSKYLKDIQKDIITKDFTIKI